MFGLDKLATRLARTLDGSPDELESDPAEKAATERRLDAIFARLRAEQDGAADAAGPTAD